MQKLRGATEVNEGGSDPTQRLRRAVHKSQFYILPASFSNIDSLARLRLVIPLSSPEAQAGRQQRSRRTVHTPLRLGDKG